MTTDERVTLLESKLGEVEQKIASLSDMRDILIELKTISKYTVERLDKQEESIEDVKQSISNVQDTNSIQVAEFISRGVFLVLGVVLTAIVGLVIK